MFSIFKKKRSNLTASDAEDIAKNLYGEFVLERSGEGFDDETNSLPDKVRFVFAGKVDLYREAMLLAAVGAEAEKYREWKTVLHSCEELVFGLGSSDSRLQKLSMIKVAMADLGRLLNPGFKGELRWGFDWFHELGDDAIVKNPVDLFLFVSTWMDEYIALVETIQKVRLFLNARDREKSPF